MSALLPVVLKLSPPLQSLLYVRALMGGAASKDLLALLGSLRVPAPRGNKWVSSMLNSAEYSFRQLKLTNAQGCLVPDLQHELACKAATFPPLCSTLTAHARQRCVPQIQIGALLVLLRIALYSGDKALFTHSLEQARAAQGSGYVAQKIAEIPFPAQWLALGPAWVREALALLRAERSGPARPPNASPNVPPNASPNASPDASPAEESAARPPRVLPVGPQDIFLQVRQQGSGFCLDGCVETAEGQRFALLPILRQLAAHQTGTAESPVYTREGRALSFAPELLEKLRDLCACAAGPAPGKKKHADADEGLQLSPYVLGLCLPLIAGLPLQADAAWEDLARRIQEAQSLNPPLPEGLRATLRPYQQEGFVWLRRLSLWAGGACLADDMGLGKSVQSLAVLLAMADQGPSLIVAPTSVCGNWEQEIQKFAPGLRALRLPPRQRSQTLAQLGAGDVLILSYGLLSTAHKDLSQILWQMIIFDEAQALKNAAAQRSRAGKQLKGVFRLALTGTPIENNLHELWSIFETVTPGLLGSHKEFQQTYLHLPPEKTAPSAPAASSPLHGPNGAEKDPSADPDSPRQQLKRLLRPFLLRRVKEKVLTELPPRSEQTLKVELSPAEMAAYQALQRQALQRLQDLEKLPESRPGQRRMHLLAQLTLLRQACCHPALLQPASPLPAAKLDYCLDLVRNLHSAGHRALVFSQFVRFLQLFRTALDQEGIPYQYLDGATPEKQRQESVRAFQAGEGSIFCISLKAGGQGLNLTGADYVIHLDPWWNPAVEDQASDRAYRMGQLCPVTVYRLIAAHTVEENILTLHQQKRDLANEVLEGSDTAPQLSEALLLELIGAIA